MKKRGEFKMAKSAHNNRELIKILAELSRNGFSHERRKSGTIKIDTPNGPIFTHATAKAAQNIRKHFSKLNIKI
ncbi:MAG: hypothetical protein ACO27Q_10810 [Bacteroidia bacterium]